MGDSLTAYDFFNESCQYTRLLFNNTKQVPELFMIM